MRLLIQTQGLLISRADRDLIRSRIQQAFARFDHKSIGATLHLQDTNGPKGGADKDCHLVIELDDTTTVITDRGTDLKAVVNRAIHRAVQALRRQIAQKHARLRHSIGLRRAASSPSLNRRQQRGLLALDTGES
ncbi:MAG TPA: hypothetical protein VFM48_13980 [Aquabacterium sp.]|nr:hypothetical protein [Aquabacterium sp.]